MQHDTNRVVSVANENGLWFHRAPLIFSFKGKHLFYLTRMRECDDANNVLKERIKFLSSDTAMKKSARFQSMITNLKEALKTGRDLRERYRVLVRRYKETMKNQSRANNGNVNAMK